MITEQKLSRAIAEAQRFIMIAHAAQVKLNGNKFAKYGCPETGAAHRASMDLTRVLAEFRSR